MSPCPFTIHLPLYIGPAERLRDHIGLCSECSVAALILTSYSGGQGRTVECPDAVTLTAYEEDFLDPDELAAVQEHVDGCGYCMSLLLEGRRVSSSEKEVERALRGGEAYILAKDIATWLATVKYPLERQRVAETFDSSFETFQETVVTGTEESQSFPAMALGFSGGLERPLSQKIVEVALIIGRVSYYALGDPRKVADLLKQSSASLPEGFAPPMLIEAAIKRLRFLGEA